MCKFNILCKLKWHCRNY